MKKTLIVIILLLLSSISLFATYEEDYWGRYQTVNNSKCQISFVLDDNGVSDLSVNDICLNMSTVKQNYMWVDGGAFFLRITCDDNEGYGNSIGLLCVLNLDREIIIIAGYYMRSIYNETTHKDKTIDKQAIEMTLSREGVDFGYAE